MPEASITRKKRVWYYVPYIHVLCFIAELTGLGIWDSYSRAALASTRQCLEALGVNTIDTAIAWGGSALAVTTTFVVLFTLAMLALGVGRAMIAYTADRTGATRMGGRLIAWMWVDAIFVCLFFLLTVWLVVLLLCQCLAAWQVWALTQATKVGAKSARYLDSLNLGNITITYDSEQASSCSLACVDLAAFEWALGSATCFCDLTGVATADMYMHSALDHMTGSIVGSTLMLVAGMWVLMASAAEFGVTRRERQLLRRIAKSRLAATGESSKLLPNGGGSAGFDGKGRKSKGKGQVAQTQDPVVMDMETAEMMELTGQAAGAGSVDTTAEAGKASSGQQGSNVGSALVKGSKRLARGVSQSFVKAGKVFDVMGSLLGPRLK